MAIIGYHASQEQFSPSRLLALAVQAEQAGFGAIHSSDHFHPWSLRQGQSGFTFSWIAAALQATRIPFSMVCAPGQRYHPAIVAQAIATLVDMFPGRFSVELGSGEALNECITGGGWPEKAVRNQRLLESTGIIRRLLMGETVNFQGTVTVQEARLYTLPPVMPLLFGTALTRETAEWLGSWTDGLLTTAGGLTDTSMRVEAYRRHGGAGKPVYLQFAFSYARQPEEALMGAWDQWRSNLAGMDDLANLRRPEDFEAVTDHITPDDVARAIPVYTSMGPLKEKVRWLEEQFGPDRIFLHNVNPYQEVFIEDFRSGFSG